MPQPMRPRLRKVESPLFPSFRSRYVHVLNIFVFASSLLWEINLDAYAEEYIPGHLVDNDFTIILDDTTLYANLDIVGGEVAPNETFNPFQGGDEWAARISGTFGDTLVGSNPPFDVHDSFDLSIDFWHVITPPPPEHGEGEDASRGINVAIHARPRAVGPGGWATITRNNGVPLLGGSPSIEVLVDEDNVGEYAAFFTFPNVTISHGGHSDIFSSIVFSWEAKYVPRVNPPAGISPSTLEITNWKFVAFAYHTPEPSSLMLLALGGLMLVGRRLGRQGLNKQ